MLHPQNRRDRTPHVKHFVLNGRDIGPDGSSNVLSGVPFRSLAGTHGDVAMAEMVGRGDETDHAMATESTEPTELLLWSRKPTF